MKRKILKRGIALLCALMLILTVYIPPVAVSAEDTDAQSATEQITVADMGSEYTRVTFSSFGLDNQKVTSAEQTVDAKIDGNWRTVLFHGTVTFSRDSNARLCFGHDSTYGVNVYGSGDDLVVSYMTGGAGVTIDHNIVEKTLTGTPVDIALSIEQPESGTVKVGFFIDGNLYNNEFITFTGVNSDYLYMRHLRVQVLANSLTIASNNLGGEKEPITLADMGSEYTRVTFSSFGLDNQKVTSTIDKKIDGNWRMMLFHGTVTFSKNGNARLCFGHDSTYGVNVYGSGDDLEVTYLTNGTPVTIDHNVVGKTLTGTPVDIALSIEQPENGKVKVGFFIDGNLYKNEFITFTGVNSDYLYMRHLRVQVLADSLTIASNNLGGEKEPITLADLGYEYTRVTFSDFGLDGQKVQGSTNIDKTLTGNWDHVLFHGLVTFSTNANDRICLGHTSTYGVNIYGSGQDLVVNYLSGGTAVTIDHNIVGKELTKTPLNIAIAMDRVVLGSTGKVRVGLFIDGQLYNNEYITFENINTDYLYMRHIHVQGPSDGITFASSELGEVAETLTLSHLNIKDNDNLTSSAMGTYTESLLNKKISMLISANSGNVLSLLADPSTGWGGVQWQLFDGYGMLDFEGTDAGTTRKWPNLSSYYGNLCLLEWIVQTADFDYDGKKDDLMMCIWVNKSLLNESRINGEDCGNIVLGDLYKDRTMLGIHPSGGTAMKIYSLPETSSNADPIDVTQADFATNGVQWEEKRQDVTGELGMLRSELGRGLKGAKLNVDVLFPNASDAKLCYGVTSEAEDGVTIYGDGEGNLVIRAKDSVVATLDPEIAGVALTDNRINLQISYEDRLTITDTSASLNAVFGVWIEGRLYNDDYIVVNGIGDLGNGIATVGTENHVVTIWMPFESQRPNTAFKQITTTDFGVSDLYRDDLSLSYNGSILDAVFTSKLRLWGPAEGNGYGNVINYGGSKSSGWYGFRFWVYGDQSIGLDYAENSKQIDTLKPEKAGLSGFTGQDIILSMSIEAADFDMDGEEDDLKVGVFFNGKLYNNRYYFVSVDGVNLPEQIGPNLGLHRSGAKSGEIRYYAVEDWREAVYLPVTPSDFGIQDDTYTVSTSGNLNDVVAPVTMDGKLLSADVTIADGGEIILGGTEETGGFKITRNGDVLTVASVTEGLAQTELQVSNAVKSLDAQWNLKAAFDNDDGDIYLTLWVNDVFMGTYCVDSFQLGSNLAVKDVTVHSKVYMIPTDDSNNYDYTEYTFGDFGDYGLKYQLYNEDITSAITHMASDEVVITDRLVMKDNASVTVSGYKFTVTDGILKVTDGNTELMTREVGAGGFDFALVQHKVDADADGDRDDISLSVFINGENKENRQYFLVDRAFDNTCSIQVNDGSVMVAEANPLPAWPVDIEDITTGYTLTTEQDVTIGVNGEVAAGGTNLTEVGDYYLVYNTADEKVKHKVAVYKDGDVNVDSAVNSKDIVALKKAQAGQTELSKAGKNAADINDDNLLKDDDKLLRTALVTTMDEVKEENKQVVVGVVSDTHYVDCFNGHREDNLIKALSQYRENGADIIIMNSDLSDLGYVVSYEKLLDTILDVFPDINQAPKIAAGADAHEYFPVWHSDNLEDYNSMKNRFLEYFGNGFGQTEMNTTNIIDGYYFIVTSCDSTANSASGLGNGNSWYAPETINYLKTSLAEAEAAAVAAGEPDRPIFVAVHNPNHVTDPNWQLRDILDDYPQAVVFTSHTHLSNVMEDQIHQDNGFTVVNTGSTFYAGKYKVFVNRDKHDIVEDAYEFGEGLLVRVAGNKVTIERHDYYHEEKIKDNWVVTTSADGSTLTDYTIARAEKRNAPVFADDTAFTVEQTSDTSVALTFEAASHEDFVNYYRIEVLNEAGSVVTSGSYSNGYHMGIARIPETQTFTVSGLSAGTKYTFKVYAVETFGKESKPITTTFTLN